MATSKREAKKASATRVDYTREELIAICERAVVPMEQWGNRDSDSAQTQLGQTWAYLRAGVPFKVCVAPDGSTDSHYLATDERTIWVLFYDIEGFGYFERGGDEPDDGKRTEMSYLPTPARLDERAGRDWY